MVCRAAAAVILAAATLAAQNPSGPSNDVKGIPYTVRLDHDISVLFSGYVQLRYTDNAVKPYQVKRLRFTVDVNLTKNVDVLVRFDPTLPSALLDGYLQFKPVRAARFTVGQFKIPFSGENLVSDERTIPIERSLVVNQFAPGRDTGNQGRDIGAAVIGNIGPANGLSLEYATAFVNGDGIFNVQTRDQRAAVGRLVFHPFTGVSAGFDYYQGREPLPGADSSLARELVPKQRQDVELGYRLGHFLSWTEYLWGHDGPISRSGGYLQTAYKFSTHWEAFARAQDLNLNHAKAANITRAYDSGVNYYIIPLIRLQANLGVQKSPTTGSLMHTFVAQVQAEF